jgi:hypothetical protein
MPDDKFDTNLLKVIAAELYFSLGLQAAREMYGKSYFSLGLGEKGCVDQAVLTAVSGNYNAITPDFLKNQPTPPIGFQPPTEKPKA